MGATCSYGRERTSINARESDRGANTYIVTHTYCDPCGNTDTVTLTFHVVVGVPEVGAAEAVIMSSPQPSIIEVVGGAVDPTVVDTRGRIVISQQLDPDSTRVACPAGVHAWMHRDGSERIRSGRVLVHSRTQRRSDPPQGVIKPKFCKRSSRSLMRERMFSISAAVVGSYTGPTVEPSAGVSAAWR